MRDLGISPESQKKPVPHIDSCKNCSGTGLMSSDSFPKINNNYPHVAIIGGGIGWVALAVACLHRGIPYTLYERDEAFDARSQGYGLTLQQASKAIEWLGIFELTDSLTSTRHVVHDTDWKIIGEWGRRNLEVEEFEKPTKRRNIHISRQGLRQALLSQLHDQKSIKWMHKLKNISQNNTWKIELEFQVWDDTKMNTADVVVWADGIRSTVRNIFVDENISPLHYLGCIVILGICPLEKLWDLKNTLLDWKTVFQTVNGHERMYMMPYDTDTIMWQFSFRMSEKDAKNLSKKWAEALKEETTQRIQDWHSPIAEILAATDTSKITGYPVYDREMLEPEDLKNLWDITILWDAMHPMSPFKGQWANQALLDALDLARDIATKCGLNSQWREKWLREIVLQDFEKNMLKRASLKVRDSAKAVEWLHSEAVMHDGESPRGREV